MSQLYSIDMLLAKNLAALSEDIENTIVNEQFWMEIRGFELRLQKYDLDELFLLKMFHLSIPEFNPRHKININSILLRLIEIHIKKLR